MRQYIVDIAEYAPLSAADELRLLDTIARGTTAEAELEALGPDSLSPIGEELRDEVAKGQDAQRTLTQSNLRLVVDIARDYEPTGRSLPSLVQAANRGLPQAIDTFDRRAGRGFRDHLSSAVREASRRARTESREARNALWRRWDSLPAQVEAFPGSDRSSNPARG
jgi:DNA-directed RNA polymerase sigma subunit (sigma70/sigma32)